VNPLGPPGSLGPAAPDAAQDAEARVRAAFAFQSESCGKLGSPFMAWLCRALGERLTPDGEVGHRVLAWQGDPSSFGDSVPLRLCGGLHALALSGRRPGLTRVYGVSPPDAGTWDEIAAALGEEAPRLSLALDSAPQTNEVARAAVVYPAFAAIAAHVGRPLELLEVGASAGLNLNCDRFAYAIGTWRGGDPGSGVRLAPAPRGRAPTAGDPVIEARSGCDLRPCDLSDPGAVDRLLSYVWPDQPERLARMRAAISIARAAPPQVDRADAVAWLRSRLADAPEGRARVVYSTIAWQYLTPAAQAEGEALMAAAGASATPKAPLAWVRFEADDAGPGAGLRLDLWDGARPRQTIALGRGDFHGRWVDWRGLAT
jgi:hypothetical protein